MVKLPGILVPVLSLALVVPQAKAAKITALPAATTQPATRQQTQSKAAAARAEKVAQTYCKATNLSVLEQQLIPEPAEPSEALPQRAVLEVPQQPQAVAIQTTLPLSLPAAVRLAFERNPDLQVVRLQLQRSCAQLRQAEAALLPTLQTNGSISRTDGSSFSPQRRSYSASTSAQSQQALRTSLQQQRSVAQQQLQQQIQQLQQRFQQTATQVQQLQLQQQIQQLQQRASSSAVLSTTVDVTPLNGNSVALPLRSGGSAGGNGGYFNGALALSYNLYTGGQREASIEASRKQIENAVLDIRRQLQQVRQETTSNYYDLQQTQALITVADSAVQNNRESLRIVQLGESAGIRTRFEVLQAAVTLSDALQNQTQAKSLYVIARRQLVQQLSLPETVDIILPSTVTPQRAGVWSAALEESIVLALNNRVELSQTRLQRQITQLQKRIVASQRKPQVQGFATVNIADDLEDRFLGAFGYSLGVQMSFNAFDGGDVRSQLRQLDQSIAILDQQFNQLKESIRFEVEQAYFTLRANATSIDTANGALTQAQEGLRLAQVRLQAGIGTTLEVTRAQADLTQAQGNLIGTVLDYNRALAALERATGYAIPAAP